MRNEKTISINRGGLDETIQSSSLFTRWRTLSGASKLLSVFVFAFLALGALGSTLKYLESVSSQRVSKGAEMPSESGFLNSLNPFAAAAVTPTPQLSKEYIYAGSRMLAVEDAGAIASPPADLAVWRPSSGTWYVLGGAGSQQISYAWGISSDQPAQGDFDGDGKTDFSVYRPSTTQSVWWIVRSSDNSYYNVSLGLSNTNSANADRIAQADYDGDGRTDVAVWRPTDGVWYIIQSGNNSVVYYTFGNSTDTPASADYDGDGRADIAVWRTSNKTFYSVNSSNGANQTVTFTQSSTQPVSADYDGDGRADYAIRSGTTFVIRQSSTNTTLAPITWPTTGAAASDIPVQNDYDGDGKVDIAVWKSAASAQWYIRQSGSSNSLRQVAWGTTGDIPVPAFYKR